MLQIITSLAFFYYYFRPGHYLSLFYDNLWQSIIDNKKCDMLYIQSLCSLQIGLHNKNKFLPFMLVVTDQELLILDILMLVYFTY